MSFSLSRLSGFRRSFKPPAITSRFNGAGSAGPRRLLFIGGGAAATAGVVLVAAFVGSDPVPTPSRPGRLPPSDPIPGGPVSNPYQQAVALRSNQEAASAALKSGQSYTSQINASREYAEIKPTRALLTQRPDPPEAPPAPAPVPKPSPPQPRAVHAVASAAGRPVAQRVQANAGSGEDPRYKQAIDRLLNSWVARPPQTQIRMPPEASDTQAEASARNGRNTGGLAEASATPVSANVGPLAHQRVLVPAGRGVRGHTITASNSDVPSPIVIEADTGPIAHQRLIGSFTKFDDYMIIKVDRMSYNGHEVQVDGVVVAPDTMEAGVASSVDQHYLSRFILPGAAAFVSGLGQAFALSNSTVVAGPLGGATALQRLNLGQQLGVGAGVAASRLGQTLEQSAPKGSTVKVDRGASVGIMFLRDVSVPD